MASVSQNQTTLSIPFAPGTGGAWTRAGNRLWTSASHGSAASNPGIWAYYSDDEGETWTRGGELTGSASHSHNVCAVQVSGTWYLHGCYAPQSSTSGALNVKLMSSNVASGTPGAFGSATVVDAGGSNIGVAMPTMWATPTTTNPRLWILARKGTASGVHEARLYYGPAGTGYTTAGNWASFTNVGAQSGNVVVKYGVGTYWTVSSAHKCTVIVNRTQGTTTDDYISYTFDPTAGTPALGTGTAIATMTTNRKRNATLLEGWFEAVTAKADYLVFGRQDGSAQSDWDLFKTVNGTTWTAPTGWNNLAAGRLALTNNGTNFHLIYNNTPGAAAAASSAMNYRTITAATDAMSTATAFSDTNAASVLAGSGTGRLWAFYRDGTSSPYNIRTDSVAISTAQTIAVGQAAETDTATAVGKRKVKAAGQAAETDAGTAVTRVKRKATGQAAEVNSATAVGKAKVKVVGQTAEADAATPAARVKTCSAGQAAETSAATTVTRAKVRTVSTAAEVNTAAAVGKAKVKAVGAVAETDTADTITPFVEQVVAVGQAAETDTATATTKAKVLGIGAAIETDVAQPVTASTPTVVSVGQAVETDTATTAGKAKIKAAGRAVETDTATPVTGAKARLTGQAAETNTATTVTPTQTLVVQVGRASDTHVATAWTWNKVRAVGQATDAQAARVVTPRRTIAMGTAAESDVGTTAGWSRGYNVGAATETDTAWPVTRSAIVRTVGQAAEVDTATALSAARIVLLSVAGDTNAATTARWAKTRAVAAAVEVDAARAVRVFTVTTARPYTGDTARPSTGVTARPNTGTTSRPATGTTQRPFAGITERP